jgi:hypothetical protein
MALKAAMWVHGTIVEAENAVNFVSRKGWGATFGGQNTFNWFHIPITTPVILDDIRPQLVKVFVFYRTNGAVIRNLHIWDAATRVKVFDNLNLSGDHSRGIDASNSWVIAPPLGIAFGLGISVGVQFLIDPGDILFTSAGADFQRP